MNNYCMIEVAFDSKKEVNKVVDELLDKKLAASSQVIESNSTWRWNSKKESSKEYLLFIKTKKSLSDEIYGVIKSIHSYDVFEFAIFDLTSISSDYLNWIEKETT